MVGAKELGEAILAKFRTVATEVAK